MHSTYHLRIKKEYAASLIEDLQKADAVEFLAGQEEETDISASQMEEVKRRIEYYDKNPNELVSWDEVRKRLKFG